MTGDGSGGQPQPRTSPPDATAVLADLSRAMAQLAPALQRALAALGDALQRTATTAARPTPLFTKHGDPIAPPPWARAFTNNPNRARRSR